MLLKGPLSLNAIRLFRGVADLYYYRHTPVARKWPRRARQPNSDAQLRARARIADMHAILKTRSRQWHDNWKNVRTPLGRTKNDLKRKAVLTSLAQDAWAESVDIVAAVRINNPYQHVTQVYLKLDPSTTPEALAGVLWYYRLSKAPDKFLNYWMSYVLLLRDGFICRFVTPQLSDFRAPLKVEYYPSTHTVYLEVPYGFSTLMVLQKSKNAPLEP